jgi:hypothetical protein
MSQEAGAALGSEHKSSLEKGPAGAHDQKTSPVDAEDDDRTLEPMRNALGEESAQVTDHATELKLTWKFDTRLLVSSLSFS